MTQETKTTTNDDAANSDESEGPVPVPRQVHCELRTVLQMGMHDPLSADILDAFEQYDFTTTRKWVLEHPDEYVAAIQRGTVDRSITEMANDAE